MGEKEEVAVGEGREAFLYNILQLDNVTVALSHLRAIKNDELVVEPNASKLTSTSIFALSYFVVVMYGSQIHATSVDIEGLAQILLTHGRALYVPAREAVTPRSFVAKFGIKLPEGEVSLILLLTFLPNPRLSSPTYTTKLPIMWILRCIEVESIRSLVDEAFCIQFFNKLYVLLDMVRGLG